jgi:hypothetical protein
MRENLMSGSMWQGMKTGLGESSILPKSRRHPLTLPPDVWESARFTSMFLASSFFYISNRVHARPHAGNASRWALQTR